MSSPVDVKLDELRSSLTPRPFRAQLMDALEYLVRIEVPTQDEFELDSAGVDWEKLNYFPHQLKKMVKNKSHLDVLCAKMGGQSTRTPQSVNELLDFTHRNHSRLTIDGVYDHSDYFALTNLLVRLLFKLIRFKSTRLKSVKDEKVFEFVLMLISCLADLSLYEDLRAQLVNDPNLKSLFQIFATETNNQLEDELKSKSHLNDLTRFWTKICRFSANICQDKHLHKVKHLIPNDYMPSLNKFMDNLQISESVEHNESNIDFYHSIVRFLKYAHELPNYKSQIIKNRILVFLCKYVFKLNKNVDIKPNEGARESSVDKILISSKYQSIVQDLIRQFLILIDVWSQSFSAEFYNQIIEGHTIEHLLWLHTSQPPHLTTTSKPDSTPSTTSSTSSKSEFKFSDFSLNLLMKLCHHYDACRSEFGRVGGLATCMSRIDDDSDPEAYQKVVELLCMSCKTASNRIRLRDSGHLVALVKLQQRLRGRLSGDVSATQIDSTLYNRLLTALCCFVHDNDAMQVLYGQGFIDSLMFYLKESVEVGERDDVDSNQFERRMSNSVRIIESRRFSFRRLMFTSTDDNSEQKLKKSASMSKKRKPDILNQSQSKSRRLDASSPVDITAAAISPSPLRHSSTSPSLINIDSTDIDHQRRDSMSPTAESFMSLSPTTSSCVCSPASFSPPFRSISVTYSNLSPAGTTSNTAGFGLSPPTYLGDEFASSSPPLFSTTPAPAIQFSPTIQDDLSSSEDDQDDDDDQELCSISISIDNRPKLVDNDDTASTTTVNTDKEAENIESINRTEACVFYVLSQLSHNEKATNTLIAHFDHILIGLLKYLKHARVRNPRALRILNRLTKNANFFRHFVLGLFPYHLKRILDSSAGSPADDTDMNVYLHSNSAFFDATSSFPSFESIEFTLFNNLKSLCISSSDPGYCCLISMMKQKSRDEKLACSLAAPFVLRNSKALCYLMIELNGLDLILDALFTRDDLDGDLDDSMRRKSMVCVRRVLDFVTFKRDMKQIGESFESSRVRASAAFAVLRDQLKPDDLVEFVLVDDGSSIIVANKSRLARQSGYFEALLEGPLSVNIQLDETTKRPRVELKDVSLETFSVIIDALRCGNHDDELTGLSDHKLTLDQCLKLAVCCDRYLLVDLRQFFIATLASKFISIGSLGSLFRLAWHINNSFLACVCVEYLLGLFVSPGDNDESFERVEDLERFFHIFVSDICPADDTTGANLEFFRKFLKLGLTEIIKNTSWRF